MARFCFLFLLMVLMSGCGHAPQKKHDGAPAVQVWGERGAQPGQFTEPRAVAIAWSHDGKPAYAYIVDSSGRIQKWTTSGQYVTAWTAPHIEKGRPEGVAILRDGNIAITNTHDSKVIIYTPEGKLLRSFGKYGTQKGGFLLVTGICVDPAGFIYTADYGGSFDRVSKWTPQGKLVASWSGHGEGPRQFRRPCGLAISHEGDLLVADIGNHRIQRLDHHTGVYKGTIGTRGRGDGQLNYPYGVAVDTQGFIYTVEFGNHRVQKWSPEGKFLAKWGGPGRAVGQLANPWGLAVDRDANVYVADTQNHRIQKFHF
jgi:DNA-binding beta-propeller fold protein YncE